ncbi:uncharacterized protein DSM5745_10449 [Aspergillus mulundensis]|uniref:Uncharacterized protein n=1 Tax=Aspergillus mulundensis TaxID=1810919 RepID=A0A3D8QJ55_9EURO|nr:hypothetical protein DSM5745_10449 [Aspergillus mulundensis]RDW61777.1 hypothetical protein DSM5745_10449 [Aspergillus mulundensis]
MTPSTTAQTPSPVHLFDLAPDPWSANVLKTRLILNHKSIPYTESRISYPDITPVLQSLGIAPHPPASKQPAPYTLPAILHNGLRSDENTHGALMDSLPIAVYLDKAFPAEHGRGIFPRGEESIRQAVKVNKGLGGVVRAGICLIAPNMPSILDSRGAEYFRRTREARFGKPLEQLRPAAEEGVQGVLKNVEAEMAGVVEMLRVDGGGPFFEGEMVSYADFVLVAFLEWFWKVNLSVFEAVPGVGDGEVRAVWDACRCWLRQRGVEREWKVEGDES